MQIKKWALVLILIAVPAFAKSQCTGDCQPGTVTGPYTAAELAEYSTTAPFPICESSSCTAGSWSGISIEGIDAMQNVGTKYQFYDDDAPYFDDNIAVGPSTGSGNAQVVEWVNSQFIQAFDKETGQPIFTTAGGTTAVPANISKLWAASTQPECEENPSGNVQVIFDRLDNSFVINRRVSYTNALGIHEYAWCIAASSSSDLASPTTQWYAYEYRMASAIPCIPSSDNCSAGKFYYYFPDWPRIGTWSNGFYITFDLTDPNSGYVEAGMEACQLDRADIVTGNSTKPMTCYAYLVPVADRPSLVHSVDVADIDSANPPPAGEPEYFVGIVNPSNTQQGGLGLKICTSQSQTAPCTSNQLALFTWGPKGLSLPRAISVAPYTDGCYNTSAAGQETNTYCVPEPSTNSNDLGAYGKGNCGNYSTPCLDSLGDRIANRLTYDNLTSSGPGGEYLTASQVVMESASNQRTGIRYYVLKVSSGAASVAVNSGTASGPPDLQDPAGKLFYFMPSTALDKNGNLGIMYTTSGPNCSSCGTQPHPSIYFDVLPWGTAKLDDPTLIVQGKADQENTQRWGEYAATVIDPTDNLTFYGVGEYFDVNQTGFANCATPSSDCYTWQTRIFRGSYGNQF